MMHCSFRKLVAALIFEHNKYFRTNELQIEHKMALKPNDKYYDIKKANLKLYLFCNDKYNRDRRLKD